MIEGINNQAAMQMLRSTQQSYQMSDEEKSTFQAILEKYDSSSMSEEDKKSMFDEIKDTGLRPNQEMKEMLDAAGFDPPARPEGRQGPPPQGGSQGQMPDFMQDFVAKFKEGTATESDLNSLLEQLMQNGMDTTGNIVDENK
jgi:hypothetical protein